MSRLPVVVAAGLGPAGPDLTTPAALHALDDAPAAFLRTSRHPAAETALLRRLPSFDDLYDSAESFTELYANMAERIVAAAKEYGSVAYGVPGSPMVQERTVQLLLSDDRVRVEIVPGISYCELAWARLGVDPVEQGIRVADATSVAERAAGGEGPLLLGQCWSAQVLSDVKLSLELPQGSRATLLHHLGLADEVVLEVAWEDVDRSVEADHLTSLFVLEPVSAIGTPLVRLAEIVRILRERCPWDREQDHHTLARHLLEEAYEAVEAIDALSDPPSPEQASHLEEELGDLLCQVYFHALLAAEEGLFDLSGVARVIHDKLVARHPHVFGDAEASTADAVLADWEHSKLREKGRASLMDGIPAAMPALALATKVERKAAGAGLGFDVTGDVAALGELFDRLVRGDDRFRRSTDAAKGKATVEQAGELLVGIARLMAHDGLDPEAAARMAAGRFRERFRAVEQMAAAEGTTVREVRAAERKKLYEQARHQQVP